MQLPENGPFIVKFCSMYAHKNGLIEMKHEVRLCFPYKNSRYRNRVRKC